MFWSVLQKGQEQLDVMYCNVLVFNIQFRGDLFRGFLIKHLYQRDQLSPLRFLFFCEGAFTWF